MLKMDRLGLAACVCLLAIPAQAAPQQPEAQQIVRTGNTTSHSTATSSARAQGGRASAAGGTGVGKGGAGGLGAGGSASANGGSAAGGQGGAGGFGGTSSASGGALSGVTISGNNDHFPPASAYAPPIVTANPCLGGIGGAAQTNFFGLAFGKTSEDRVCQLHQIGENRLALEYLIQTDPDVRKAYERLASAQPPGVVCGAGGTPGYHPECAPGKPRK